MDESLGHYTQWNKLNTKEQILCDCTDVRCLDQSDSQSQEVERWLPGAGEGKNEELSFNGYSYSLGR